MVVRPTMWYNRKTSFQRKKKNDNSKSQHCEKINNRKFKRALFGNTLLKLFL